VGSKRQRLDLDLGGECSRQGVLSSCRFQTRRHLEFTQCNNNWNSVSETTGSGVKLEYQGATDHQLTCDNCLTILRGSVFDKTKRHLTGLNAFSTKHDQIISYASIEVDPVLTNSKAIADALAHELDTILACSTAIPAKRKAL
jgi:hypothetical protein